MSQEYIEITEKTVDDAITAACRKLSVTSNRLDYIVVQREKSGFLGFGAKPAIIKARVKDAADAAQAILDDVIMKAEKKVVDQAEKKTAASSEKAENRQAKKPEKPAKTEKKETAKAVKTQKKEADQTQKAEKKAEKDKEKEGKKNVRKNKKKSPAPQKAAAKDPFEKESSDHKPAETEAAAASVSAETAVQAPEEGEKAAPSPKKKVVIPQLTDEKIAEIKKIAHDFLIDIFGAMDMDVVITEDYQKDTGILTVDMEGEDMGVLIGKRGQTLDSLQYLLSLVVNKDVDGYIHVKADTENYRERRKKTLENLAKNIAFKVKRTRQPAALEPMNPYERRIIHSALQNEKYIITYSEGEEPFRKVIVDLKKDENGEDLLKEERFEKGGRGRGGKGGRGRGGRRGRDNRGSRNNRRSEDNAGDSQASESRESFEE